MLLPSSEAKLASLYQIFERSGGAVDQKWVHAAKACTGAELDELVDKQRYVLAGQELRIHNPMVKLARAPAVFTEKESVSLEAFFSRAITHRFAKELLASAHSAGKLVIDDPLVAGQVSCDTSICGGNVIFLRFQGAGEPFYLVQNNFAVEALYFPLRQCLVSLIDCLVPRVKLRRLFLQLFRGAERAVEYFARSSRKWAGLLIANESPYHFFYFQVPGVAISCFDMDASVPGFHTLAAEHYADVPALFHLGESTRIHRDQAELQSALVTEGSFVFSVGLRPKMWISPQRVRMIDDVLLAACRHESASDLALIAREYDLVLLAGISSGKRAWREEVEGIAALVGRLSSRFSRVLLLLDGWTATLAPQAPPDLYAADAQTAERVRQAVPANVHCLNLVGANPARKIGLGSAVDFFMCSHGTASLYVARVCGRPGVSHISNAARTPACEQHIHPRTRLVPEEIVIDLEQTDSTDKFRVGYSIQPNVFVDFAESVFDESRREPVVPADTRP